MNASRLAIPVLTRASRSIAPRSVRHFRSLPRPAIRSSAIITKLTQQRPYSQENQSRPSKLYTFSDVQALTKSPSSTILIDTREPSELQSTGTIPGSLNIPITSKPDSFFISPKEFEDRFGFERPGKDAEVVFYCKSGVRSRAAAELARQGGWVNVGEYSGSWLDWEKNGGEKELVK